MTDRKALSCSDNPKLSYFHKFCSGKASSKKWIESIKAVSDNGTKHTLRKWIAKECTNIGFAIVGHKLRVWRPASSQYFTGTVQRFDVGGHEHLIAYKDASEEALWLAVESYEDMGKPRSPPPLCCPPTYPPCPAPPAPTIPPNHAGCFENEHSKQSL